MSENSSINEAEESSSNHQISRASVRRTRTGSGVAFAKPEDSSEHIHIFTLKIIPRFGYFFFFPEITGIDFGYNLLYREFMHIIIIFYEIINFYIFDCYFVPVFLLG